MKSRLLEAKDRVAQHAEHQLRRLYLALPLRSRHRWTIKRWGFRLSGWLLHGTGSYQRWASTERHAVASRQAAAPPLSPADIERALRALSMSSSPSPQVSVVIPVHGQLGQTLRCLAAIARNTSLATTEVIVVDDGSPDTTADVLSRVAGLRLVLTDRQTGFVGACNLGAAHARGRYLVFLNNDTEVLEGWCDELIRTFDDRPDAGIVGAKLIYPDGQLQEAGGIIWRDGSGWNYGRGDDAGKPEYSYRRDVDYVSGAALAIPRALFRRLAGFDERYAPGYGEDSDLAFKVRELGRAVIYQPLSRVIHVEGATAGRDLSAGMKAHQVDNARKLHERWRSRLVDRPLAGTELLRARDRRTGPRVLVLDHCTPEPDKDAGSITALNLMRLLQRCGWLVTFVPEDNYLHLGRYTNDMQRQGIECLYAPHVTSLGEYLRAHGETYDMVLVFRFTAARRHLAEIRRSCPCAKVLFHTSDLHSLRLQRQADLTGDAALADEAARTREEELAIIRSVDATIVHSPVERRLVLEACPAANVHVFGWAIDIPGTDAPLDARRDVALVGGYQHPPNVDAALYFAREIHPRVAARLPGVRFLIVGSNPPDDIRQLASSSIDVVGFVEDLRPYLDRVRVAVAPIRYGAGIKGKIITTMSHGVPTVVTSIAAEGIGLTHEQEVLIADGPEAFADAVIDLYTNDERWLAFSQRGEAFTRERFSFEGGLPIVASILASLGLPADSGRIEPSPAPDMRDLEWLSSTSREAYLDAAAAAAVRRAERTAIERRLVPDHAQPFFVDGYCVACHAPVRFRVGREHDVVATDGSRWPNWREHLVCDCGLNARARAVVHVLELLAAAPEDGRVYLMEQTSPLYRWLSRRYPGLVGSEFVSDATPHGGSVDGVRHEDATALSFENEAFDCIVSCDVLEHVPDYRRAFAEAHRCLRPDGHLLFTVPFVLSASTTLVRARVHASGEIEHLERPEFHGDPRRPDAGILCFQHFGWDVLADLAAAGFRSAEIVTLWSRDFGYFGEQIVVHARK